MKAVTRVAGKDTIIACSPGLEQYSVPSVEEIKEAIVAAAACKVREKREVEV
jgi:pyruvate/2-oxoglutarate/acetoin dehydrogenase E1 component